MDEKNLFENVSEEGSSFVRTVKKTISSYLPFILLFLNVGFRIILSLYVPTLVNPFTLIFLLDALVSVVSTMVCYLVFIPQGESKERLKSPSYKPNCTRWGSLSSIIRTGGFLERFREYCRRQLDVERRERREYIIENRTTFSFEEYEARFAHLTKKELKALRKAREISRAEYRAIKKSNGKIELKPINPVLILSGVAKANYNDAGRENVNYITKWLAKRPLFIIVVSVLMNALGGRYIGLSGLAALYSMVIDVLFIIVAAFIGYGAGEQIIRDKDDKIKNRILFIEGFMEDNSIPFPVAKAVENEEK